MTLQDVFAHYIWIVEKIWMRLLKKFAYIVKPLDEDIWFCLACWRGSLDVLIGLFAAAQTATTPET